MFKGLRKHLRKVLWDEEFTFKGNAYVWHFQMWEAYLLGIFSAGVLYMLMLGGALIEMFIMG